MVIGELTLVTVRVVIMGAYCCYCDSGDRGLTVVTVTLVIGELTVVTVIVVTGGNYCSYCESGDRGSLL